MTLLLFLASVASAELVILPAPVQSEVGASTCMTREASLEADLCGLPKRVCVKRVAARVMRNRWGELVLNHGGMRIDDAVKTRSVVSVEYDSDGSARVDHDDQVVAPKGGAGHRLLLTIDYRQPTDALACGVTFELDMTVDGRLVGTASDMRGWVTDPTDDMAGRADVSYIPSAD